MCTTTKITKRSLIGNEHFKRWLKRVDPGLRIKTMSRISESLAEKGLPGSKIREGLVQLSKRCLVMLIKLNDEDIQYYSRPKKFKKTQTISDITNSANHKDKSHHKTSHVKKSDSKRRHKKEKLKRRYEELFGKDYGQAERENGELNSSSKQLKIDTLITEKQAKDSYNREPLGKPSSSRGKNLLRGPKCRQKLPTNETSDGFSEETTKKWNSMGLISPSQRTKFMLGDSLKKTDECPRENEIPATIEELSTPALIIETRNPALPQGNVVPAVKKTVEEVSKVGTIRVKDLKSLLPSEATSEKTRNAECVGKVFLDEYRKFFDEGVESTVLKLGELLCLAVSDRIRRNDRIKRAKQLSSDDLIREEAIRAEHDFSQMIKIRGNEFVPLYYTIVNKFNSSNKLSMTMALFCRLLNHACSFDAENSNVDEYTIEARHVMSLMLSTQGSSQTKDNFNSLDFNLENIKQLYQLIYPYSSDQTLSSAVAIKTTKSSNIDSQTQERINRLGEVTIKLVGKNPPLESSLSPAASPPGTAVPRHTAVSQQDNLEVQKATNQTKPAALQQITVAQKHLAAVLKQTVTPKSATFSPQQTVHSTTITDPQSTKINLVGHSNTTVSSSNNSNADPLKYSNSLRTNPKVTSPQYSTLQYNTTFSSNTANTALSSQYCLASTIQGIKPQQALPPKQTIYSPPSSKAPNTSTHHNMALLTSKPASSNIDFNPRNTAAPRKSVFHDFTLPSLNVVSPTLKPPSRRIASQSLKPKSRNIGPQSLKPPSLNNTPSNNTAPQIFLNPPSTNIAPQILNPSYLYMAARTENSPPCYIPSQTIGAASLNTTPQSANSPPHLVASQTIGAAFLNTNSQFANGPPRYVRSQAIGAPSLNTIPQSANSPPGYVALQNTGATSHSLAPQTIVSASSYITSQAINSLSYSNAQPPISMPSFYTLPHFKPATQTSTYKNSSITLQTLIQNNPGYVPSTSLAMPVMQNHEFSVQSNQATTEVPQLIPLPQKTHNSTVPFVPTTSMQRLQIGYYQLNTQLRQALNNTTSTEELDMNDLVGGQMIPTSSSVRRNSNSTTTTAATFQVESENARDNKKQYATSLRMVPGSSAPHQQALSPPSEQSPVPIISSHCHPFVQRRPMSGKMKMYI